LSAAPKVDETRIRRASVLGGIGFGAFAAFLLFAGDNSALFAALPPERAGKLIVSSGAALLFLTGAGIALAALPLFAPLFAPQIYLRRPRSTLANGLIGVVLFGAGLATLGVLFGSPLQEIYFEANGYRLCNVTAAPGSLFLRYQTWAIGGRDCARRN
jgi:hypothetical protein